MHKIEFEHGGKDYDSKYPDGIPTSIKIEMESGEVLDSKLIMYPGGHCRNTENDLQGILDFKFRKFSNFAL